MKIWTGFKAGIKRSPLPAAPQPAPAKARGGRLWRTLPVMLVTLCLMSLTSYATGSMNDIVQTLFGENTQTLDIILLLTILTLLPSILIMLTGFTRIIIVLGMVRNAMGTQQTPPNQVLVGLALFLTMFIMQPVLSEVYNDAYIPYTQEQIDQDEFTERAMAPIREFMLSQTHRSDMDFFLELRGEMYESYDDVPTSTLIPAFLTSEIKLAFKIAFFIYIPFIVIDMVVASTLMAMGMMMLPPAMISLPFKILLFVMVDGWQLVLGQLVGSFSFF